MRQAYESRDDRSLQQSVADRLAALWRCDFVTMPQFYEFDYAIAQDKVVKGFVEVKVRNKHYPTLLLSLHKWQVGLKMSELSRLPFLIVSSTPAGLFWIKAEQRPLEIVIGGRADRNDSQDVEPCVLIPYASMTKVREAA